MMCAARHVAEQGATLFVLEDGSDHRHVRQMGAAEPGMVGHHHVARLHGDRLAQAPHAEAEGPEVDRDVGRVDHELPRRIEQGAGEVEPLLDVGGDRRALEPLPHLAHDGREAMGEQLQLDGFGSGIVDRNRSNLLPGIIGGMAPGDRLSVLLTRFSAT